MFLRLGLIKDPLKKTITYDYCKKVIRNAKLSGGGRWSVRENGGNSSQKSSIRHWRKTGQNYNRYTRDVFEKFRGCLNCAPVERRRKWQLASPVPVTLPEHIYFCRFSINYPVFRCNCSVCRICFSFLKRIEKKTNPTDSIGEDSVFRCHDNELLSAKNCFAGV